MQSNAVCLETTDAGRALQLLVELVSSQSDHVYVKASAHFFYLPLERESYAVGVAKRLGLANDGFSFRAEFNNEET